MPATYWQKWNKPGLFRSSRCVQNLLRKIIVYLGLVAKNFIVGRLQELFAPILHLRPNRLFHPRVREFPLTGGFFRYQLHYLESEQLLRRGISDRNDLAVLPRF